ncbi:MAG: hypothetical protein HZA54_19660 [Planctomycetes bacterium]|nr:hypothetical protein [Planctomycetota bacterium]
MRLPSPFAPALHRAFALSVAALALAALGPLALHPAGAQDPAPPGPPAAQPAAATIPYRSPGGRWSVRLPAGWLPRTVPDSAELVDRVRFGGPLGPFAGIQVETLRRDLPLPVMVKRLRDGVRRRGTVVQEESRAPIGGRAAWVGEYLVVQGELRLRVVQAALDLGPRKLLLAFTGPDPLRAQERALFADLLASAALGALPVEGGAEVEFAMREFGGGALRIDLPSGGVAREEGARVEVTWEELGLEFRAAWRRTAQTPAEAARADFADLEPAEQEGLVTEVVKQEEAAFADGRGVRVSYRLLDQGARILCGMATYRATGPGELLVYGLTRLGGEDLEAGVGMARGVARAAIQPRLGAGLGAAPALETEAEIWQGRGRVKLPAGWAAAAVAVQEATPGVPAAVEKRYACAPTAPDLGVTAATGTVAGGGAAFEAWLRGKAYRKRDRAEVGPARPISVGGKAATAWSVTHGPSGDRWSTTLVVRFEGDRFELLASSCPRALEAAYGGLAERVAATAE